MDYLFTTDVKTTTVTNSLWQIDEHVDSGCEKEDDDIDDDFVLKFSTDESDCEDAAYSNDSYFKCPTASEDLAKNGNDSSSMQTDIKLTTCSLRYDDKIINTTRNVRRKNTRGKVISNRQKSVLDYFLRRDISDGKVSDEIKEDTTPDVTVEIKKLICQLQNVRVILERLPDSLLVKNDNPNTGDYQETTCMIKRYCASCNRTYIKPRSRNCFYCDSSLKYECAKCGIRYSSQSSIRYHQNSKCFMRTRCPQCKYSCTSNFHLKEHIKAAHVQSDGVRKKLFRCLHCYSEKFSYYWELMRHKEVCKQTDSSLAENGKKRKLSSCEFLDATPLKKTRVETLKIELKLIRAFCSKCAKSKKVVHNKTLPRRCWDSRCRSSLRYECTACGKQFISTSGIRYHVQSSCPTIILTRNVLQCDKCAYVSHDERRLHFHLKYNHVPADQKVELSCDYCNKKFKTYYKLRRHQYYCESESMKCEL